MVSYLIQRQLQAERLFCPNTIFEQDVHDVEYRKEPVLQGQLLDEEQRPLVEVGDPFGLRPDQKHQVIRLFRKYKSVYCCFDLDEEVYNTGQILFTLVANKGDRFALGSSTGVLKVFDAFSVKLEKTFDFQAQKISLMILSKDDRFLIVADNKCVIHVYDFQTYEKLSQINNLRNSEVSFMDMLIVDSSSYLVVCTREHGLWVYRRELFDGSILGMPFEQGSKLLLPFGHWSCCEISHKTGRINAIDTKGILHSWGDVPGFFEDEKLESESKIIFDSKYRPEIMLVNESLNLILLHNKNMHFFIKVESNNFQILEEQKYPKINPRMKERGVVVNHNTQYCMVAVNVEKKREGSIAELGLVKSTLFLYEYVSNSKVHLISKIDEDNTEIELNANIFLIQTHPTFRNVFITGDYEGQIIVWDMARGVVLKVFKEKFYKATTYAIPNPILEIQFFPNGLQFVISTYYGVVSLFGYGACHNVSLQPDEQFFEKEILKIQSNVENEQEGGDNGDQGMVFDINAIEENPLIIYSREKDPMRTVEIEQMLDEEKDKGQVVIREKSIPLGDLIDLEDDKENERVDNEKEKDKEKEDVLKEEKEGKEKVNEKESNSKNEIINCENENEEEESEGEGRGEEFSMGNLVNDQRLSNLTREPVSGYTLNLMRKESEEFQEESIEDQKSENDMGYFCNSNLERHNEWSLDSDIGYFDYYQRNIKKARKRENNLMEEYHEQQKILMDIYFKEKLKMPKTIKVNSEMPLVPHLIESLGLVFKKNFMNQKKVLEAEEDTWESEEETFGVRTRRRRNRDNIRELRSFNSRVPEPPRQPVIRRVMTRSRARELGHDPNQMRLASANFSNQRSLNQVQEESENDSEEEAEICRRRMRTRSRFRLDQLEQEEDNEPKGESSIGAKAGERRRKNIQKSMSFGMEGESRKNSREGEMGMMGGLQKISEGDKANETPGRIINSINEQMNKKKKFCFECHEEISSRKKKKNCANCRNVFHLDDCMEEGLLFLSGEYLCLLCFFEKKNTDKNFTRSVEQEKFSRISLNRECYGKLDKYYMDQQKKILGFELIEGDEIMLIPQMFKSFLKSYCDILPSGWIGKNIDLLIRMKEDLRASVLDISYETPQVRSKSSAEKFSKRNDLHLFQILKLKIQGANINELRTKYNLQAIPDIVPFCMTRNIENLFILPVHPYDFVRRELGLLNNFTQPSDYLGESYTISNVNNNKPTIFEQVDITPSNTDEIMTRQKQRSLERKAHPQHLMVLVQKFLKFYEEGKVGKDLGKWELMACRFESILEQFKQILFFFKEEVDKKTYNDYLFFVEYEMNMDIIISRLKNGFYFYNQSIQKDLSRIVENAKKYNPTDSPIIDFSEFLKKVCIKAMEGDLTENDQQIFQAEFLKLSQSSTESDKGRFHTQPSKPLASIDQPDTKIILKKTEQTLRIQPRQTPIPPTQSKSQDQSLNKRPSIAAFPGKRAPSSRLKRVLRRNSIVYTEEESSEEVSLKKMINTRKRTRLRRNGLNGRSQGSDKGDKRQEGVPPEDGDAILQQIFENNGVKGESKVRTRRRTKFEQSNQC